MPSRQRDGQLRTALTALLFLLPTTLIGCSRESRASAKLAEIDQAYAESELGIGERFAEFTIQYEALAEDYEGTAAGLEARKWLMTGTSSEEEEKASAELATIENEFDESDLDRAEKRTEFTPRYQAFAEEFWGTEAALEAKYWLMSVARRAAGRESRDSVVAEYADAVFQRYAQSPHLEGLGGWASSFNEEQVGTYLGRMRDDSPHAGVQAAGIYHTVQRMQSLMRAGAVEDTVGLKDLLDADLQLLIDEYADVPRNSATYGIMADAVLNRYSAERLAIGQPAPEIVGRTADGEEIRLSDFLGKVVVIDFWGDW